MIRLSLVNLHCRKNKQDQNIDKVGKLRLFENATQLQKSRNTIQAISGLALPNYIY